MKACPSCGGCDGRDTLTQSKTRRLVYQVVCQDCGLRGPERDSWIESDEAWDALLRREDADAQKQMAQQAEAKAEECAKQLWAMVCDDTGCQVDEAQEWLEAQGYVAFGEWLHAPQPGDLDESEL